MLTCIGRIPWKIVAALSSHFLHVVNLGIHAKQGEGNFNLARWFLGK